MLLTDWMTVCAYYKSAKNARVGDRCNGQRSNLRDYYRRSDHPAGSKSSTMCAFAYSHLQFSQHLHVSHIRTNSHHYFLSNRPRRRRRRLRKRRLKRRPLKRPLRRRRPRRKLKPRPPPPRRPPMRRSLLPRSLLPLLPRHRRRPRLRSRLLLRLLTRVQVALLVLVLSRAARLVARFCPRRSLLPELLISSRTTSKYRTYSSRHALHKQLDGC